MGLVLGKTQGKLVFLINGTTITTNTKINVRVTAPGAASYYLWSCIILTHEKNENTIKTYLNGEYNEEIQISNLGNASGGNMILGACNYPTYYNTQQYIDELSIWNKELSSEEVEMFFNNGNGLEYADWNRTTVPWMDYILMPDPAVTTAAGYMYIFKKGTYNGKDCVMTDFTFVPSGTTTIAYCRFYFRLEEATTLTFKYMHHTTNSSYLAFRLDSASAAAFLAVNAVTPHISHRYHPSSFLSEEHSGYSY